MKTRITLLGAGKLATGLAGMLSKHSFDIVQVYSRSRSSAEMLGRELGVPFTDDLHSLSLDANLFIIAIPDDAIASFAQQISLQGKLVVHTSAATKMEVLAPASDRYGVFYPLQTFTKGRDYTTQKIPFFIEANTKSDTKYLEELAAVLSPNVFRASLHERQLLHLAATFVSNFSNHLFYAGEEILSSTKFPFDTLLPLIQETIARLFEKRPSDVQTGPAIRGDQATIAAHLDLLKDHPEWTMIYKLLSASINPDLKKNFED